MFKEIDKYNINHKKQIMNVKNRIKFNSENSVYVFFYC